MLSSAFIVEPASSVTSPTLHPQQVSDNLIQKHHTNNMKQASSKQSVLNTFKRKNSCEVAKIKTIVIDKDPAELGAIQRVLPGVNIVICKFHVKQAVNRHLCSYSEEIKDTIV